MSDAEGGFAPDTIRVAAGATVRWVWEVPDQRTVTFDDPTVQGGGCWYAGVLQDCEGQTVEVTFPEPGPYDYVDEFDGFTGTVVVEPAASPSATDSPTSAPTRPSPTPEPEPSPSPSTSSPSPSPTPRSTSPSPSPTPPSPTPSSPTPAPEPSTGTAAPVVVESDTADPTPTPTPGAPAVASEDRSVPVPSPSFEDFPAATDPQTDDVDGTVAIGAPDDGSGTRTVWGLVGGASVLGTLGAFGRRVLFADPWHDPDGGA